MAHKILVVIGGPTGVGKTEAAIRLATHFGTGVINADSRQVYKELVIGVGRPTSAQLKKTRHHLIGHVSIFEPYSAGRFITDALRVLDDIFSQTDIAVLCGGTGLYVKSLIEGIDPFPEIPETVTEKWIRIWKEEGLSSLIESLGRLDPEYLGMVDKENPMRLIRALAVSEYSGKSYSSFLSGGQVKRDFKVIPILLELPRPDLYKRIDQRVIDMMQAGWMNEAESLYPYRHLKALQTVGYKELFDVIEGHVSLEDAVKAIQQSTRRYAKRQLTWFRNQGTWHSFSPGDEAAIIDTIAADLKNKNG